MNKAVANQEQDQREQLSALADGQLQGRELSDALSYAAQGKGRATWELYHLVGDVLRSSDLARPANPAFMARLRDELAKEQAPAPRPEVPTPLTAVAAPGTVAANASVFRWKMAAGFASLAAVAAIGWNSMSALQGGSGPVGGAQLAQSADRSPSPPAAPTVAVADAEGQQVMIRDPRLDELLAAHKQFGSTSALQMPAGFLRNATFDAPGR